MTVNFYNISKKENSTKQPTGQAAYSASCTLKEDCDILHPVLLITASNLTGAYNYCSFTIVGVLRYYHIIKIVYVTNDLVEVYCSIDVLATWKDTIMASDQFVTRCSDALKYVGTLSEFLNDSATPATIGATVSRIDQWEPFKRSGGYYVIGFNAKGITNALTKRGSVSYVIMDQTDLAVFQTNLFSLTGVQGDLAPIQYVASCVYIPIPFDSTQFTQVSDSILMGPNYTLSIGYRKFNTAHVAGMEHLQKDFSITDHPDAASHGMYLNYEPYKKVHVVGSSFGDFDLPINIMPASVRYQIHLDLTDGSAIMEVCNQYTTLSGKRTFCRVTGQIGVPIAMAQSVTNTATDAYRIGSNLASSLGAAVSLNFGKSIAEMGAAVMASYEGSIPKLTTSGSNGSLSSIAPIDTNMEYCSIIDSDLVHVGKPFFKTLTLNTITSGSFIQCRNPILELGGLLPEEQMAEKYMADGFYYE